ncbi:MAG: alpha/beta fold hydrolase [Candidatus Thiodiazotropha sp.]
MATADVNGIKINYVHLGNQADTQAEHMVMVHGLATNMAFWYMKYAEEFSHHYKVTLFDLRGHGRSETTSNGYTVANMALDLEGLLDHLGIEKAHFMAHSFGGNVVLRFALNSPHRISSLLLADTHISAARGKTSSRNWEQGKKIVSLMREHGVFVDINEPYIGYRLLAELARLRRDKIEISLELYDLVKPVIGNHSDRSARQWLDLLDSTDAEKELMRDDGLTLEQLSTLKFPILAIYGERSLSMSTGMYLLDTWPHADFQYIREAGHFFPVTQPETLIKHRHRFREMYTKAQTPRRRGDEKRYFRSDRLIQRSGEWFLLTREGEIGAFQTFEQAESALAHNLEHIKAGGIA